MKGKYYKRYCPCPEEHGKMVHLTPSGHNYVTDLLGVLKRRTYWKETPWRRSISQRR